MRIQRQIEIVPVLAAIGVTIGGEKLVLALQAGDKESASGWREFFKDLKARGLDGSKVILGVMDGFLGLETRISGRILPCEDPALPGTCRQQNVLAKVPKKLKEAVAKDLRAIFYAPSKRDRHGVIRRIQVQVGESDSISCCLSGEVH